MDPAEKIRRKYHEINGLLAKDLISSARSTLKREGYIIAPGPKRTMRFLWKQKNA